MATTEEIEVFRKAMNKNKKTRYKLRVYIFKKYHEEIYGTHEIYKYQKEYFKYEGKKAILCCGRQIGKSTMNAADCVAYAFLNNYFEVILASPTKPQTKEMFTRIKVMINSIEIIRDYMTICNESEIRFMNGSVIKCVTANDKASRGYTADLIVLDEAALIDESVFTAIDAVTLVRDGMVRLLSTPREKKGRFYEIWSNPNNDTVWKKFHVKTYDNKSIKPEKLQELEDEMQSDSDKLREIEGLFADDDASALISARQLEAQMRIYQKQQPDFTNYEYFVGADIATSSTSTSDYTAISVFAVPRSIKNVDECKFNTNWDKIRHVKQITRKTPDTYVAAQLILDIINEWRPVRIAIDANGSGKGVYDTISRAVPNKKSVIPMNLRGVERVDAYTTHADLLVKDCVILLNDKIWKTEAKTLDHYANVIKIKNQKGRWDVKKNSNGHDDILDSHVLATWTIVNEIGRAPKKLSFCNDIDVSQLWMQPRGGFR